MLSGKFEAPLSNQCSNGRCKDSRYGLGRYDALWAFGSLGAPRRKVILCGQYKYRYLRRFDASSIGIRIPWDQDNDQETA
jgi:hypothetical protein